MVDGQVRIVRERGRPEWDVIVGARFVVAIAAPAPDATLAAFARLVDDADVSIERLVGATPPPDGPGDSFALAWWPEPPGRGDAELTVVVRGTGAVDLELEPDGPPRRVDARDIRPWHLAEFAGARALRVIEAGRDLPDVFESADGASGSVVRVLGRQAHATGVEWRSAAAVAARRAGAADVDTRLAAHRPGEPPGPDDEAVASATTVARYRVADGEPRDIRSRVLLGRRPLEVRVADDGVEIVALPEADASVSATHLELRVEGARLVATDLHSTNGTIVRRGSRAHRMRAGESIVVSPGTLLRLGGGTIIEILPPRIELPAGPDRQAPA